VSHAWAYTFTKIVGRKKVDVLTCPCGVVGYRPAGTEVTPVRAKRFKAKYYESCVRPPRPRIVSD
jgi:hypothetical protein